MKNGKKPTLVQKKVMITHGMIPENWLVVKDLGKKLEVVSRNELKKVYNGRKKTRIIDKTL